MELKKAAKNGKTKILGELIALAKKKKFDKKFKPGDDILKHSVLSKKAGE